MPITFPIIFGSDPHSFQGSDLDSFIDDYIESTLSESNRAILIHNIQNLSLDMALLKKFFFEAILKQDLEIIRALIDTKKIDVNIVDENSNTALFYSSKLDDFKIAGLLLENNADVNFKNKEGDTPLMQAAIYSSVEMLNLLLFYGALINDKNLEGTSALMYAVSNKKYQNAKALISNNANVDDNDNQGITILMEAILQMGTTVDDSDLEIIETILTKIQNIDAQDSFGETALMKTKNVYIALKLLNKKTSLSKKNNDGCSPLLIAAKYGLDDLIDLYMSRNANIKDIDNDGWTALMLASNIEGNTSTIKTLLKYCSKQTINHRNKIEITALKIAVFRRNTAAIIALIEKGALFEGLENFDVSQLDLRNIQIIESPSDGEKTVSLLWETRMRSFYFKP